jgi:DNA-nicking Smr family endonuclease
MHELDLHGVLFHEAEEVVLKFVDTLFAQHESCGRIIHGHGVLAGHLAQWLGQYPHVASIATEVGNSGSSIVWLEG